MDKTNAIVRDVISQADAARLLGISRQRLGQLVHSGKIRPAYIKDLPHPFVFATDIRDLVKARATARLN